MNMWGAIRVRPLRRIRIRRETIHRHADADSHALNTAASVRMYTRTTRAQVIALCEAVRYLSTSHIRGDIVACGTWRGGSMLAAARTLLECDDRSRTLWLYDTFGIRLLAVERTIAKSHYPAARIKLIEGAVEETIPENLPTAIALLRIGSDEYEQARHELTYLAPRLAPGAVLIVDDYGQSQGARRAVDEYIHATGMPLLLHRIDRAARIGVLAAPPTGLSRLREDRELAAAVR